MHRPYFIIHWRWRQLPPQVLQVHRRLPGETGEVHHSLRGRRGIGHRRTLQQPVFRKLFGQELIVESKPVPAAALAWAQANSFPGRNGYTLISTNLPHIVLQARWRARCSTRPPTSTNVYFYHLHSMPSWCAPRANTGPIRPGERGQGKAGEVTFAGSGTNSANHWPPRGSMLLPASRHLRPSRAPAT